MKKILILGAYTHMIDVVKTAKNMGFYTIIADREPSAPAKAFADKAYDISTGDLDRLAKMATEEKIDGVINAFDDFNTWQAQALCERLGLPYYATKEQLEICSDKARFKNHCRKFNVPVIEEYDVDALLRGERNAESFPVIVKPVDSYASQGITVCHSLKELEQGYQKAQERSKTGTVIVERFIDNSHGVEMYYTVKNGNIVLTAMTDRYVHKVADGSPPLPTETRFPSEHLNHYVGELDGKVRDMIRGMDIENGLLFIQSLYENGKFYLYEMGFRLSGEQHYQIIEKQTGINLLEMMLDFQTGGDLAAYPVERFDNGYTKFSACNLALLLNAGQIEKIVGLESILEMPGVLSFVQLKKEGDQVEAIGNYGQMFGRFNIVCKDEKKLNELLNEIYRTIKVLSTDGPDLIEGRRAPVPEC